MASPLQRKVIEDKRHFRTAQGIIRALRRTEPPWDKRLIRADQWGFRGQANSNWELIPSALRKGTRLGFDSNQHTHVSEGRGGCRRQLNGEFIAVQQFLEAADRVGLTVPGDCPVFRVHKGKCDYPVGAVIAQRAWPSTDMLELLAMAQHHGVPTRLLDFTFNPLVALYWAATFALANHDSLVANGAHSFAVWGIDLDFLDLDTYRFAVVQVPKGKNSFLHAQQAFFILDKLVNGDRETEESLSLNRQLDELSKREAARADRFDVRVIKYTVPLDSAQETLRLLALENIDKPHLMPTFDNVVLSLKNNDMPERTSNSS
jgi:FRG domain